jgi:hypothetical protein
LYSITNITDLLKLKRLKVSNVDKDVASLDIPGITGKNVEMLSNFRGSAGISYYDG